MAAAIGKRDYKLAAAVERNLIEEGRVFRTNDSDEMVALEDIARTGCPGSFGGRVSHPNYGEVYLYNADF